MNREMLMLVEAISREKNVEREVVFGAVESALSQATKKLFIRDKEPLDYEASSNSPIWSSSLFMNRRSPTSLGSKITPSSRCWNSKATASRSEERRVGKEIRSRWAPDH